MNVLHVHAFLQSARLGVACPIRWCARSGVVPGPVSYSIRCRARAGVVPGPVACLAMYLFAYKPAPLAAPVRLVYVVCPIFHSCAGTHAISNFAFNTRRNSFLSRIRFGIDKTINQ